MRKVLLECITCKRLNESPIKLNQSDYRDFRVDPPSIPFRYIIIDYMGPFTLNWNEKKTKAWILIITCLWSRAVNMKVFDCRYEGLLDSTSITHEFGMFERCFSDLCSQITAGSNIIANFLDDYETNDLFREEWHQKSTI